MIKLNLSVGDRYIDMNMCLPSTMCGPNMVNLARLYGGETDLITETLYKYGKPRFYGNGKTDLITKT